MGMMLCSSMPAFEKVYCKYNPESLAIMAISWQSILKWKVSRHWSDNIQREGLSISVTHDRQGRIKRLAHPARAPLFFAEIRRLTLCGGPKAKRMHQIEQINFENYIFSPLLRGHIPLRHPLSPQALKFCQSLIWTPPLFKNPGSAPDRRVDRPTFLTIGCVIMALGTSVVLSFSFVSLSQHSWRKSVCENWE